MKFSLLSFGLLATFFVSGEAKRTRSYGGKCALDGQFPFVALLSYRGSKHCGASIIHERWAVTAAHCLDDERSKPLLTVGTVENLGSGMTYEIEKFYVHHDYTLIPEYENKDVEYVVNDIGLIRLASSVLFSGNVQPIVLATDEGISYENITATLTGWGSDGFDEAMSNSLRFIETRILALEKCRQAWPFVKKHICTSTQEHKGVCYGDSGSPLVFNGKQIGLASTADAYCESVKPDVFTKVASFIPWIRSILNRHGDALPDS